MTYSYTQIFNFLLANYLAVMIISAVIAWAQYKMSGLKIARYALFYWLSIVFGGITQGFAENDPVRAALAMLCSTPSAILLILILAVVFNIQNNWRIYWVFWIAMTLIGGLLIQFDFDFKVYAIPFSLAVALPVTIQLIRAFSGFKSMGVSRSLYWMACFLCISNLYSYPWLRLENEYQLPVFIFSFWNGFFTAVSLPLVLLEVIRESYSNSLEQRVAETSKDLVAKNQILTKTEKEKTNLLRLLCHDIANLVSISEFSSKKLLAVANNLASHAEFDTERALIQKHGAKLTRAIANETELVRNIRNFLSVSQGKSYIALETFDLSSAVHESLELNSLRAEQKSITLRLECKIDNPFVKADRTTLVTSVLNNFISNAIKFSMEGGEVLVRIIKGQGDSGYILEIIDHGVGISSARLASIFADDSPTSTLGTSGEAGTGFGLPIARHFCQLYGAKLTITSKSKSDGELDSYTKVEIAFP